MPKNATPGGGVDGAEQPLLSGIRSDGDSPRPNRSTSVGLDFVWSDLQEALEQEGMGDSAAGSLPHRMGLSSGLSAEREPKPSVLQELLQQRVLVDETDRPPEAASRTLFVDGFRPRTPRQSLDAAEEDDLDGINGSVDSDTLGWSVATDVETAADGPEQLNKKIEDSHIRFVCFVGTFAAWVSVMLPAPFFPSYAADCCGATDQAIGCAFACNPLAQILTNPLWAWIVPKTGRPMCTVLGLLMLGIGSVVFAVGGSIPLFFAGRLLQGAGFQGTVVAVLALLIESSDDLERDMGIQELAAGMGFMLGPAIGGFLFPRLGYTLSIYPAAVLAFVTAILAFWVLKPWRSNVERDQTKILPTIVEDEAFEEEEAGGQELGIVTEAQHEGEPIPWVSRSTWGELLRSRIVVGVCLSLCAHAASQSFCDMVLGRHVLLLSQDKESGNVGAMFSVMPAVYSIACVITGRASPSNSLLFTIGLAIYALSYYLIAPPFFFVSPNSQHHKPDHEMLWKNSTLPFTFPTYELSSVGEWIIDIASLAIMGVGSAMVLVPSIPLMRDGFEQGGGLGDPTDAISSLYSAAWSLGELIGPPFGGTLLEMMPTREELNCAKPSKDCVWSYYSALTVFSGILGFFAVMMAFLIRESQEGGQDSSDFRYREQSEHEAEEHVARDRGEGFRSTDPLLGGRGASSSTANARLSPMGDLSSFVIPLAHGESPEEHRLHDRL